MEVPDNREVWENLCCADEMWLDCMLQIALSVARGQLQTLDWQEFITEECEMWKRQNSSDKVSVNGL